ncbi:TPA: hypothetical protein ACW7Y0_003161 [Aeromonas hydrophila]|uniref:hypothetical protein n=1 Tax=Aeromonas hydrophila TaxID=644 RepID=UPI004055857C
MNKLEKVRHLGHEVTSIDFSCSPSINGGGYFDVNIAFDVNTVSIRDDITDENEDFVFSCPAEVTVIGYENRDGAKKDNDDEDKYKVFTLKFIVETIFAYPEKEEDHKQLVENNRWFFENFSFINIASSADDILKNTPYRSVRLLKDRR